MNEVKKPQKPLLFYYIIAMLILFLFNALVIPQIAKMSVKEVDYGTFITMTEEKELEKVDIQDNQIVFTDKEMKNIYKTGLINDPDLDFTNAHFCSNRSVYVQEIYG